MNSDDIRTEIAEVNDEALTADGFDDAIVGYVSIWGEGQKNVVLYDREKCIEILMTRDSMTREDAEEHFEFNVAGAYMGPNTPAYATILRRVR